MALDVNALFVMFFLLLACFFALPPSADSDSHLLANVEHFVSSLIIPLRSMQSAQSTLHTK